MFTAVSKDISINHNCLSRMSVFFVVAVILFINCYSVNLATGVQNVFTAAKLVAILIVICGGAYKLAEGNIFNWIIFLAVSKPVNSG